MIPEERPWRRLYCFRIDYDQTTLEKKHLGVGSHPAQERKEIESP